MHKNVSSARSSEIYVRININASEGKINKIFTAAFLLVQLLTQICEEFSGLAKTTN